MFHLLSGQHDHRKGIAEKKTHMHKVKKNIYHGLCILKGRGPGERARVYLSGISTFLVAERRAL